MSVRKEVAWFVKRMEKKLKENDNKGGWKGCTLQYLSMRITQEKKELSRELKKPSKDKEKIINECADIANFAMMVADNVNNGRLY